MISLVKAVVALVGIIVTMVYGAKSLTKRDESALKKCLTALSLTASLLLIISILEFLYLTKGAI